MSDQPSENHRMLIDRANRLMRQSRALRKMSDELHKESKDVRDAADGLARRKQRKKR